MPDPGITEKKLDLVQFGAEFAVLALPAGERGLKMLTLYSVFNCFSILSD